MHHIWPVEEYPEYAWEPWNHLPVTDKVHDAMHDRATRKLTELGERWRRRSPPPHDFPSRSIETGFGPSSTRGENFCEEISGAKIGAERREAPAARNPARE